MRKSPMPRRAPLKSGKPLARKTALVASPKARSALHQGSAIQRRTPKRRPAAGPAIPTKIRLALALRSGGMCEVAAEGCTGAATDFSHRKKTGAGGRKGAAKVAHDVLSNALAACRHCHARQIHAEPASAYSAGWMLREHQDPVVEPVLYRGAWRWLTDDGSVQIANPYAEEAK